MRTIKTSVVSWWFVLALNVGCQSKGQGVHAPVVDGDASVVASRPSDSGLDGSVDSALDGSLDASLHSGLDGGGAGFDPRFDVAGNFEQACTDKCREAEPASPAPNGNCISVGLESCTESCLVALRNVDASCAGCVVESMVLPYGRWGCNDWECSCGPPIQFLQVSAQLCPTGCEASFEYQEKLRDEVPKLESTGRSPTRVIELAPLRLSGIARIGGVYTDSESGLFALHSGQVKYLDTSGQQQWALDSPGTPAWAFEWRSDGYALLPRTAVNTPWRRVDTTGAVVDIEMPEYRIQPRVSGASGALLGLEGLAIRLISLEGEVLQRFAFPDSIVELESLQATEVVEMEDGSFVVKISYGIERQRQEELAHFTAIDGQEILRLDWRTAVSDSARGLRGCVEAAASGVLCAGFSTTGVGVWLVTAAGRTAWQWNASEPDVQTLERQLFTRGDGSVLLVTTEDPETDVKYEGAEASTPSPQAPFPYPGVCSVYGCARVVVRNFSADGTLLWSYEHRADTSKVDDATMVGDDLYVLAMLYGEEQRQVLMVFEP